MRWGWTSWLGGSLRVISGRPGHAVALTAVVCASVLLLVALLPPLYHVFTSPVYLPLHTLLELASVLVSAGIFLVNWQASRQNYSGRNLFLGAAFFSVAALDSLHILAFPGMPEFVSPSSTNKGILFWLDARLIEALALLAVAWLPALAGRNGRPAAWYLSGGFLLLANGLLIGVLFAANSLAEGALPAMFVPGTGLTPLKVALEYLVIAVNLSALLSLWLRSRHDDEQPHPALFAALVVIVFSELAFTLYQSAYDSYNLLGHGYKVVAYYLIFRALFVSAVEHPYRVLARSKAEQERLYRSEVSKTGQLFALGRLLNAPPAQSDVLSEVARAASSLLGAEGAAILLRDKGALLVAAADGAVSEVYEGRLIEAETLAGKVIATGRAHIIDDLEAYDGVVAQWPADGRLRAVAAVPLRDGERTVGALEVFAGRPTSFSAEDVTVLAAFADAAGVAINKAAAHDEIRRLLGELRAREERLVAQNERLAAQSEEIRAQNEQIQAQHAELAELYAVSQYREAQLRTIVDASSDGILVVDGLGKVAVVNRAFETLTGYQAGGIIGKPCHGLLSARDEGRSLICDTSCPFKLAPGEVPPSVDALLTVLDGREVWVNVAYGPIYDRDGRTSAVVHAIRDISVRKDLERHKDDFLSAVAHDLRSPLTAIKGHAQLLMRKAGKEGRQAGELESLRTIGEQTERMREMISQLLDLTRIQMGRFELRRQPTDLVALVAGIVNEVGSRAEGHSLVLKADVPVLEGNWDRSALERVVANLIDNAVKYSPQGGTITATVARTGEQALVAVDDQGIGIPSADLDQVFDRYYRTGQASAEAKGLGLGLYIAKSLVTAHGGRIWAESTPGRGTTVTLTLPLD